MDRDGDGTLTCSEFLEALGLPHTETTESLFALFDHDEDGTINFREFLTMATTPTLSSAHGPEEGVDFAFSVLDADGDGFISYPEACVALRSTLPGISEGSLDELFHKVDQDKDGRISRQEFIEFCTKNPEYGNLILIYQRRKAEQTTK
mmetsp:Transcript_13487/g.31932  ORF Transcript_13487/g.31932 Transcript_13487/m.31932 type:complete len:149 (+) Transcript_13487:591-1037(+)